MRGLRGNVWRLEFRVSEVIVLIRCGDPARSIQPDFGTSAGRSTSIFPQAPRASADAVHAENGGPALTVRRTAIAIPESRTSAVRTTRTTSEITK